LFFLDNYILDRREAIAALLTFRGLISPHQHSDVEKGEEKDKKPEEKEKAEEKAEEKTCQFLGNEENITVYPDGIPEQSGVKWVEKLFDRLKKDGSWDYDKAYDEFKEQYPRVASGRPRDPWVKKKKPDDNDGARNRPLGCCSIKRCLEGTNPSPLIYQFLPK